VSIPTFFVVRNRSKHLVNQNLPLDGNIKDFVKLGTFRTKFFGYGWLLRHKHYNIIILPSSGQILLN